MRPLLWKQNLEFGCLRDFRKYSDTVLVSAAICHLFKNNKNLGKSMGFEPTLKRIDQPDLTPDLAFVSDYPSNGVIFELKWSVSPNKEYSVPKLKEVKKYFDTFVNWKNNNGFVENQDVVLVCHPDDYNHIIKMIESISSETEYDCFKKEGFSIWTWLLNLPRLGEQAEEMRLIKNYGKLKHKELEAIITKPMGTKIPEEVLTYNRFTYFFVKEKPPIQYLMNLIVVGVLPNPDNLGGDNYVVDTDWIWRKTKTLFAMGEEYDNNTLQFKKKWIVEALDMLAEIDIIGRGKENSWIIPKKLGTRRKPIQKIICKKLAELEMSKRKPSQARVKSPLPSGKERKITDFFG